jgi:hypothetical protein
MTSTDERFEILEARIRHLEDVLAIQRLVALYGPAVDSNSIDLAAGIWSGTGVYSVHPGADGPESTQLLDGRDAIAEMLYGPYHQGQLVRGCAHVMSAPLVAVAGDRASALCYLTLINHTPDGFVVSRQSANRWELERTADGWRVTHRATSLLDGRSSSVDMLRAGLDELANDGGGYEIGQVHPADG